ncbi:hypothetical protein SAMN05444365_101379 [Micromonospora pattaloongensis]|uniref:Uncharacterized protein n=1 Tax=Micromonospora pattaloongensis TaxID=405436 RepID=A0A1H3GDW4_9ACTN|nr:hypothetical protein [Micromonospora pattaloongensis]SDY01503.1 hypothetical protein SAMN05444365_101379 [Micromonospora pattaloongensis]
MADIPRDVVERLYAAPPGGFVAARDEAVAAARKDGDARRAREIAKLRKPTVSAWLVNLLALRRPELVAELVELSAALRAAQRELRGEQLRELSAQRRAAVTGLVNEARTLAREAGPRIAGAKLPLAEVEATLTAALSDEEIAAQVQSGRLVRAVTYAGFGEVPRPRLRLVTGGREEQAPGPPPTTPAERERAAKAERDAKAAEAARAAQRRALDRELAAARTEAKRAETELERAAAAEQDGAAALAELDEQLAELRRRRSAAEEELGRRKLARKTAERDAAAARRRAGEVQAALESLDADGGAVRNRGRKAESQG